MKLLRMAAAIGVAVWVKRQLDGTARHGARTAHRTAGRRAPRLQRSATTGSRASAASAASGAYRDDRDVTGVGVLRDEEMMRP